MRPEFPNSQGQGPLAGRRSIAYNVASSVGGQSLYLLTQLGVLSALAHLRGPEAVGEFGLALAIAAPLFVLGSVGGRTAQSVDIEQEYNFAEYAGVRLAGALFAASSTLLLGASLADRESTFLLICVVTAAKTFEAVSDLAYGAFQQQERLGLVFRSLALRGVLSLLLFVVILMNGFPTASAFLAQLLVWMTVALFIDYPAASRLSFGALTLPVIRWPRLRALVARSLPISGDALLVSFQTSIPRLELDRVVGLAAVGTFTAVGYLQQAGTMIANSISQAILSRLSHLRMSNGSNAVTLVAAHGLAMLLLGLAGLLFVYVLRQEILYIVAGATSPDGEDLVLLVAIAIVIRIVTTAPAAFLYAGRVFKEILVLQLVVTSISALLCLLFIPSYGLVGAGYVLVVAAAIRGMTIGVLFHRHRKTVPIRLRPDERTEDLLQTDTRVRE